MKLLLTSTGITNSLIENEMWRLLDRQYKGLHVLFCTTASNYDGGDMSGWLVKNLIKFKELDFEIDLCDLNGACKDRLLARFEWADVLYFEGGNTQWLRECLMTSGLEARLPSLLKDRVWIGASAGSCVLCPTLVNPVQDLFDETLKGFETSGLGLVNFQFVPHLNNPQFSNIREDRIKEAVKELRDIDGTSVYVCDDEGAVSVDGDTVELFSGGRAFILTK
jgi:peptidase E